MAKRHSGGKKEGQPPAEARHHKNVIQSDWKLLAYVHASGKCDVQATFDVGSDELRANVEVAISYLKSQPKQGWRRPKAAKLVKKNGFRDFYEIRFKADRIQQRPIGYFGPGAAQFTILIWAIEQGGRLLPAAWHDIATRLMSEIEKGKASAREFTFTTCKAGKTG